MTHADRVEAMLAAASARHAALLGQLSPELRASLPGRCAGHRRGDRVPWRGGRPCRPPIHTRPSAIPALREAYAAQERAVVAIATGLTTPSPAPAPSPRPARRARAAGKLQGRRGLRRRAAQPRARSRRLCRREQPRRRRTSSRSWPRDPLGERDELGGRDVAAGVASAPSSRRSRKKSSSPICSRSACSVIAPRT